MENILLIKSNGTRTRISQESPPSLQELQSWVGGFIEYVSIPSKFKKDMVVNEEGLIHNLPFNQKASLIAKQPIVGDVILIKSDLNQNN